VLVLGIAGRRAAALAALTRENLPAAEEDLEAGAVAVLGDASLRIRRLPMF
jgi:hypothetical protein